MSEAQKRKHRATGKKPPGGARARAGRPTGGRNALPLGAVAALKAAGLRVPEGTDAGHAELADRALQRIVDVMEGRVFEKLATPVLTAARTLREEVCGPVKQRVEHSYSGLTDEQLEARFRALTAKPEPAPWDTPAAEPEEEPEE